MLKSIGRARKEALVYSLGVIWGLAFLACANEPDTKTVQDDEMESIFQANQLLSPGINLGNALEAPSEGEWGVTIEDEFFQIIKAAGFNSVRIPIRWSAHALAEAPYTIETAFLQRVKHVVDVALAQGLVVVINIHHYDEICLDPTAYKTRLLGLWQQIADFYKDYSSSGLFFEILNEPHDNLTAELWNQYLEEARQVIRQTNPTRPVVVGTAEWGGVSALNKLNLTAADTNLIVTIHYYEPFHFTHQGAEWVSGSDAWLGTTWTRTLSEVQAMTSHFSQIKSWAEAHRRPIYIGEFGAYHKAEMTYRALWTETVVNLCQQYGFSYAYWEFCSGFGAYDPVVGQWREPLLNALVPRP